MYTEIWSYGILNKDFQPECDIIDILQKFGSHETLAVL